MPCYIFYTPTFSFVSITLFILKPANSPIHPLNKIIFICHFLFFFLFFSMIPHVFGNRGEKDQKQVFCAQAIDLVSCDQLFHQPHSWRSEWFDIFEGLFFIFFVFFVPALSLRLLLIPLMTEIDVNQPGQAFLSSALLKEALSLSLVFDVINGFLSASWKKQGFW